MGLVASSFREPVVVKTRVFALEASRYDSANFVVAQNDAATATVDQAVEVSQVSSEQKLSAEPCKNEVLAVTPSPENTEQVCVETRSTIQNGGSRYSLR